MNKCLDAPKARHEDPETVFARVGETVVLNCAAKSIPYPQFLWLHNGYEIFENIEIRNDVSKLYVMSFCMKLKNYYHSLKFHSRLN